MKNDTGYKPSHPWYYMNGGEVLRPDQIKPSNQSNLVDSFSGQIDKAKDNRTYLARLERERALVCVEIDRHINRYREILKGGESSFKGDPVWPDARLNFCTALSLKHNHIKYYKSKLLFVDQEIERVKNSAGYQFDFFDKATNNNF